MSESKGPVVGIFREEQRFTQGWLWALLIGGLALSLGATIHTVVAIYHRPCPPPAGFWWQLAFPNSLVLLIVSLFVWTRLVTEVRPGGIFLAFRPFQFRPKMISYSDIVKHEAVNYRPIVDYGGWGIRRGRNGHAYNVSGNRGLLLTLKSGKTFLIGSQQVERLKAAVDTAIRNYRG